MTSYGQGTYYEKRTATRLRDEGYFVLESRGSHGPADLVAVKAGQVLLVQVKKGSAALSDEAWNLLYAEARRVRALPLIADWPARGELRLRVITGPHYPRKHDWPAVAFTTDEAAGGAAP
jgi:Holliday junction resolvase